MMIIIYFFLSHYHHTTTKPHHFASTFPITISDLPILKTKAVAVMTSIATPADDQNTIAMTKEQDCFLKAIETGDTKVRRGVSHRKNCSSALSESNNGTSALMVRQRMVTTKLSVCLYSMVLHGMQLTSMEIALVTMLLRRVIRKWWTNSCVLGFKQNFFLLLWTQIE